MNHFISSNRSGIGNGSAFLIVIFSVLCLAVFALLTVSSAKAEQNLARRTADSVTAYYQADSTAEVVFAGLRAGLRADGDIPGEIAGIALTHYDAVSYGQVYITYSIEVDDANLLAVGLIYDQPEQQFAIAQWRLVSATEWQPEEEFHLWNGKFYVD